MSEQESRRVLVVDDYVDTAEIACVLLNMMGHTSTAATTGRDALEIARTFDPEIVLLDLSLPDMHGHDVARCLRAELSSKVRIVALTGSVSREARAKALAAGFDRIEWKPIDAAKLRRVIADVAEIRAPIAH